MTLFLFFQGGGRQRGKDKKKKKKKEKKKKKKKKEEAEEELPFFSSSVRGLTNVQLHVKAFCGVVTHRPSHTHLEEREESGGEK